MTSARSGTLQLFRTQTQLDGTADDIAVLKQYGVPYEVLDRDGCIAAEPALAAREGQVRRRACGCRRTRPATATCSRRRWPIEAEKLGVQFAFNVGIERTGRGRRRASPASPPAPACCRPTPMSLALGSWSPRLLRPLGISLPVYPVKGYSITVPIIDADGAPVSTVMDESYKVAITRLGDRIRVGGTAEISGYSDKLYAARRATLDHSLTDLFPRGGDLAKATFWSGLRPMTPDGPPVIGADALRQPASQHRPRHARLDHGLRLGQGAGGHAVGRKPDIDASELAVGRYDHRFG